MAELDINKSAFDACYDNLKALSGRLHKASNFMLDASGDTSLMAEKEQQCYNELLQMIRDLASLADETAQDVKLSKARYVLADQ